MNPYPIYFLAVPGNGCPSSVEALRACNFYGSAEDVFTLAGWDVRLMPMPDPLRAREAVWIPFIVETLCGGSEFTKQTVIVGHSSGAAAALRLAEAQEVAGLVLVAAYDDDLGDDLERGSGYFDRPFDWSSIVKHSGFIVQFAGADDSLVPIAIQRLVAGHLRAATTAADLPPEHMVYIEVPDQDHFFDFDSFPDQLLACVTAGMGSKARDTGTPVA
jgi:uncharacterized protein